MSNNSNNNVDKEIEVKKKKIREHDRDNGFADWGGYMAAKRAKLMDQFEGSEIKKLSNIFEGIAIHVNGLTRPPIDELKNLMAAHGGHFHMYKVSNTTHIIASNLPNVKIKHLGTTPVVKPSWITDSIDFGKLLDYRRYLLYNNQSKTQPKIEFPLIEKSPIGTSSINNGSTKTEQEVDDKLPTDSVPAHIKSKNQNEQLTSSVTDSKNTTEIIHNTSSDQSSRFPTKTASDPNFLEEFYNNSRLHLISTLGAEFKHLVGQMRDTSDGKFPGREKLALLNAPRNSTVLPNSVIMHIDMDCFFVSVSLRNHPELKGKPVAITHARNGQITNVRPDQRAAREQEFSLYSERMPIGVTSRVDKIDMQSSLSEIASCSYEARKCGIKNGTFLGQAIKMCPDLKTLPYDFEGIKEVSHTLYQTIASYTLDIEAVSCDEMYVDVTKILKQTGLSVDDWATHIRQEIMTITGCPCSTGFGSNRLQARLATKKAKPEGQYYLHPDDVENYMVNIALSDLPGVGRATLNKLQKMGLYTCGDVQLASLKVLQNEIGQKAGETLKEQALGVDNKPLNYHHERKSVSADVNYGIRFKTIEECYTFLQNLSAEVFNRMNDINMRARCLTLKLLVRAPEAPIETAKFLGHGICDSLTKSTTSNSVLNNPQVIFKEAKLLYEKLGADFSDLRGVGIQLTKLEKNVPLNTALTNFLKPSKDKEISNTNNTKTIAPATNDENKGVTEVTIAKDTTKNKEIIGMDVKRASGMAQTEAKKQEVIGKDVKKASGTSQKDVTNVSRRGRPKNSKNNNGSKSSKKSANSASMNKYFGKTKAGDIGYKNSQQKDKGNKIDLNVLNELPEELRKEIIKEYNLETKFQNTEKVQYDSQNFNEIPEEKVVVKRHLSSQESSTTDYIRKSPFSNLTWDQIKPIIRKWTQSEDSPYDMDIEMLAEHFKQLAIERRIEILMSIFNFLHRIFSELSCSWHEAYFKIINITQEGMVARYGRTLLVNRQFKCCGM